MIIFGTRGVTLTKDRGEFHCPQCQDQHPFQKKLVRRFFTLYFIPLIPLDKLGEYVECGTCEGTFHTNVLDYDPREEGRKIEALYLVGMKQVMIATLVADGEVDDNEVRELQRIFSELSGITVTEEDLREEIDHFRLQGADAVDAVQGLAGFLNDEGKERVLAAGFAIAAADGEVTRDEIDTLIAVATGLGMSTAHTRGLLSELMEAHTG